MPEENIREYILMCKPYEVHFFLPNTHSAAVWHNLTTTDSCIVHAAFCTNFNANLDEFVVHLLGQLIHNILNSISNPCFVQFFPTKLGQLEMWANAQSDGCPAEYRWRPLFNVAVWLTPTTRVPPSPHIFCTGRMPFLLPNQQRQSTEGTDKVVPSHKER